MDLNPTSEEEHFRATVRDWLAANLPAGWGTSAYCQPETPAEQVAFARTWQGKLRDGGWAGITWPTEYGGRGASVIEQLIYNEEYARLRAPDILALKIGLSLVGPTLIHCGAPWQKERFLPRILAGDEIWCQGFSEPNAGSDLASVRTKAELHGDEFHVSGQKIWTSVAQHADWCMLVVRTSTEGAKHKGLSFLLVDMKSPGIIIRPLREMTGEAWFNEVFFDDVRVPKANVVGEINGGWNVVMTTLGHERAGTTPHVRLQAEQRLLARLAQKTRRNGTRAADDPLVRQKVAQFAIEAAILRYTAYRNVTQIRRTGVPGAEGSLLKIFWSELEQRLKDTAIEILGPIGLLPRGEARAVDDGFWFYELLWSRSGTIYAGTSEVQRNIIAQRVLGLPR
ncbi:MAG: acyl-CoA dehydrogenase family protein [Deltaproteobacteria bacterium]|nr:acyl-CoA dehydrogenase family protein [Deltaproteobacteria bacterium]MBI3387802.1 acyl-CoA dehydrogenase family protein [Deltaproteobacteria bacterium]